MAQNGLKQNRKLQKRDKALIKSENKRSNIGDTGHYFFIIFLAMCIALGGILLVSYGKNNQVPPRQLSLGKIILEAVEGQEGELKNLALYTAFLSGDNELSTYMKRNMKPIQDRVSSLRTQTAQYEQMEQIPGGPTHFITTSMDELDKIRKRLGEINFEISRVSDTDSQRAQALYKNHMENSPKTDSMVYQQTMITLEGWKVYIGPSNDEDIRPETISKFTNGRTLDQVLETFKKLGTLFSTLAEIQAETNKQFVKHNLPPLSPTGVVQLEPHQKIPKDVEPFMASLANVIQIIKKEIQENHETYKTYLPLTVLLKFQIHEALQKTLAYQEDQVGLSLGILSSLVKEIHVLRIRLNNLKIKYTKKNFKHN